VLLRDFDLIDYLSLQNNKSCFVEESTFYNYEKPEPIKARLPKKDKNYFSRKAVIIKDRKLDEPFFEDSLKFKVSKVQKNCCETRTCLVATEKTRNLQYSMSHNIKKVLKHPFDQYGFQPEKIQEKMNQQGNCKFFMFDIKKMGWSFPRSLVVKTIKKCYDITGHRVFEEYADQLESRCYIYIQGQKLKTKRGSLLGMNDNICSFILSSLFTIFQKKYLEVYHKRVKVIARFKGDDSYIKIKTNSSILLMQIWKAWTEHLKGYGVVLNKKKSILASSGIYLEVYGNNDNFDTSDPFRYMARIIDILDHNLIAQKKEVFNGMFHQILVYGNHAMKWQDETIESFFIEMSKDIMYISGKEFPKGINEFDLPFEMGGWKSNYKEGWNTFWYDFFEGDYDPLPKGFQKIIGLKEQVKFSQKISANLHNDLYKLKNNIQEKLTGSLFNKIFTQKKELTFDKSTLSYQKQWAYYAFLRTKVVKEQDPPSSKICLLEKHGYKPLLGRYLWPKKLIKKQRLSKKKQKSVLFTWTRNIHKLKLPKPSRYRMQVIINNDPILTDTIALKYLNKVPIGLILYHAVPLVGTTDYLFPKRWLPFMIKYKIPLDSLEKMLAMYGKKLQFAQYKTYL
jgi:hypothetical protein